MNETDARRRSIPRDQTGRRRRSDAAARMITPTYTYHYYYLLLYFVRTGTLLRVERLPRVRRPVAAVYRVLRGNLVTAGVAGEGFYCRRLCLHTYAGHNKCLTPREVVPSSRLLPHGYRLPFYERVASETFENGLFKDALASHVKNK